MDDGRHGLDVVLRARLIDPNPLKTIGFEMRVPFEGNLAPAFGFRGGTLAVQTLLNIEFVIKEKQFETFAKQDEQLPKIEANFMRDPGLLW